jgi:hypothetical protein
MYPCTDTRRQMKYKRATYSLIGKRDDSIAGAIPREAVEEIVGVSSFSHRYSDTSHSIGLSRTPRKVPMTSAVHRLNLRRGGTQGLSDSGCIRIAPPKIISRKITFGDAICFVLSDSSGEIRISRQRVFNEVPTLMPMLLREWISSQLRCRGRRLTQRELVTA